MILKPDGFLRLRQEDEHARSELYFYLEVDRSTERLETLVGKMHAYRDHLRRGGLPARYGAPRDEWKQWPFRVLWTFRSERRLQNVAAALTAIEPRHGGPIRGLAQGNRIWLSTRSPACGCRLIPVRCRG